MIGDLPTTPTPAMIDDTILPFSFPAVHAKKITAAFDGGRLTSNGGVMLLAMAERRLGLAEKLARVFPDRRDPTRIVHSLADMFRARLFAICCGYEDADDLDHLRCDPAFAHLRRRVRRIRTRWHKTRITLRGDGLCPAGGDSALRQ